MFNWESDQEFCFCILVTKYSSCRVSREALKVATFSLFYVKRETGSRRFPFNVNVMINLSNVESVDQRNTLSIQDLDKWPTVAPSCSKAD